jgi:phage baseplate assembly protein W
MPLNFVVNISMALYKGYNTVNNNSTKVRIEDSELIKRDLLNHFNIRKGEKLMRPEFGSIIWDALFEPMTEDLRDAIVDDVVEIVNYDPRIVADKVLVDEYKNGILIELQIRYSNLNQTENLKLMFDQNVNSVTYA